jgi:hypothetical protein
MDSDWVFDTTNAHLASMAARYDLALARQLFSGFAEGALARRVGLVDWGPMAAGEEVFQAAAVVDPARAEAMIGSLPEPSGLSAQVLKNAARLAVARILVKTGADRWRDVERRALNLPPGESEED